MVSIYSFLFSIPIFYVSKFLRPLGICICFLFSLASGFGLFIVLQNIKSKIIQVSLGSLIALVFIVSALPFVRGDMVATLY